MNVLSDPVPILHRRSSDAQIRRTGVQAGAVPFVMAALSVAFGACGTSEVRVTDHPVVGQTFAAGGDAYYREACKPGKEPSCGPTPRIREVDRALTCASGTPDLERRSPMLYERARELGPDARFTVVELLRVRRVGLEGLAFPSDYVVAVLRDDGGRLSTTLFGPSLDEPYGFGAGGVCDQGF